MRFAADEWLWGVLFSLVLAAILALQGFRLARARRSFGTDERIAELLTAKTGLRRTLRGVLSCLAVALAFVAAAQPQYGKGTRVLPATNLDVVIVLDYSKSMYARDVSPSRIGRAKVETAKLIRKLGGARFAAVAFAGDTLSFPLTSDGSAIAQFFRGMEPSNMPVGGTAIARALETGRQLLLRDPLSQNHEKVMILVTDGEDLEGDPASVAQQARADGIRVDVVQIGGQSPEPIPEVDENGVVQGLRKGPDGQLVTTQLTPEGEAQLAATAREGGGKLVRAKAGDTGIDEMTRELRTLMTEQLSERVETVFANVYYYPLALAVLLLFIETWIGSAKKRTFQPDPPKGRIRKRKPRRLRATAALLALSCLACEPFDALFERESPVVNEAIFELTKDDGDLEKAEQLLTDYLETGPCEEGVIGAGTRTRQHGDASFDLGLVYAALGRASKGDPSTAPGGPAPAPGGPGQIPGTGAPSPPGLPQSSGAQAPNPELDSKINCGLRVLASVSGNKNHSAALRARVWYLAGNLEMLRQDYEAAVVAYDEAILLAPGVTKTQLKKGPLADSRADEIGVLIAHNRALALRLQEEKEKQQQENQENQSNQEEQQDQKGDEGDEQKQDQEGEQDEESQSSDQQDEQKPEEQQQEDEKSQDQKPGDEEEQQEEPSPGQQEDEQPGPEQDESNSRPEPTAEQRQNPSEARDQRMLDLLEQAPTLQQHRAEEKKNQGVRVRSTMEDK